MRIAFRAHQAAVAEENGAVSCGFSGNDSTGREHYLTLQASSVDHDTDDWGIYLELDDQINSGYNRVEKCRLRREQLSVDVRQPLGKLTDVDGFDIILALEQESYDDIQRGLLQVFRRAPAALTIL
jgi:hypothetical protein